MIFSLAVPVTARGQEIERDSSFMAMDTTLQVSQDSVEKDTVLVLKDIKPKNFLEDPISGTNEDSLVFFPDTKMVYLYSKADVKYQDMNIKSDYMRINMDTKELISYGKTDTTGVSTRTEFIEGKTSYTMDTLTYNIDSKKAKIKGVATQDGEGYLISKETKKMPDNSINIAHGKYTTCSNTDHPHFYLAMTKGISTTAGKNRKMIVGPSYLVMEDVPVYFLGIPFGFFPNYGQNKSGFIMPEYGEVSVKGFFVRDGGYYFKFNDYMDMSVTGGIYSLGSWEADMSSRYIKRYKYSGSFNLDFSKAISGDKGTDTYVNQNNFKVTWSHSQDSKFRPNSTFAASVNFSTSGYAKNSSTSLSDYLNTQTNSSISYSKTWAGTPFSFSTNLQHSQNSSDTTVSLSFPNAVLSMSRIYPFKRKVAMGKTRWYEKISLSYTGSLTNTVTVHERDLFTQTMFDEMNNGVKHYIPLSTSLSLFGYITVTPSINYTERWYFRKINKEWDDVEEEIVYADTTYGFYRVYNYSASVSASTKVYGTVQFKENFPVQAIRHVMTPTVGFSYAPNFGKAKYGYWETIQNNSYGGTTKYSPFSEGVYGVPGSSETLALSFSLANSLEAKIKSRRDTTGVRKITIFDNLSASSSYNFLADSLNLSTFSLNLRTTIYGNFGLNISAVLDPYEVDKDGNRINTFMMENGKIGRISSTGWSFGYTFNSKKKSSQPAINNPNSGGYSGTSLPEYSNYYYFNKENRDIDPNTFRTLMSSNYYDFNIPWNLSFNYSLSYSNTGIVKTVTQTLGFNGSITLTPKTGITFSGGWDFEDNELTPGTITISRDLHCWSMNLTWIPTGYLKSWSFTIRVKSSMLQDLKYEKSNSYYDTLYYD